MVRSLAGAYLLGLVFVAGCTSAGNRHAASVVAPGSDWVSVGSQVEAQDANLVITPGKGSPDPEDLTLSLHFSFAVMAHKGEDSARAEGLSLAGSGKRPEDAFTITGMKAPEYSVEIALSFVNKLYPGAQDMRAHLLNGPGTKYVGQFDFASDGTKYRAYFDLTPWADAIKAGA